MLGERLRKIRTDHKLTQQNIADVLGIDRTTYTVYEIGVATPSPATLVKLAQIYNVTVGYLIGVEENHPTLIRSEKVEAEEDFLNSDPIAMLKKDEKELLMFFRVLPDEEKKRASAYLKKLVKKIPKKL